MELKVGSVVQLKSGGPLMTVMLVDREQEQPNIHVEWFSVDGDVKEHVFFLAQLGVVLPKSS